MMVQSLVFIYLEYLRFNRHLNRYRYYTIKFSVAKSTRSRSYIQQVRSSASDYLAITRKPYYFITRLFHAEILQQCRKTVATSTFTVTFIGNLKFIVVIDIMILRNNGVLELLWDIPTVLIWPLSKKPYWSMPIYLLWDK